MVVVVKINVMIAAENVPNAIKGCVRGVLSLTNVPINVTTVINAIAGHVATQKFIYAVDAMPNVAMIVDTKGIGRNNRNAQHVSNRA